MLREHSLVRVKFQNLYSCREYQRKVAQSKARIPDQGIDAGVGSDVDEVLVEFAPGNTERPLTGRVEDGRERDADTDEDEVGQRQIQHDRVGRRPQPMIARDGCHDRQVPDEPEDSDDAEDDRYGAAEHPSDPAVRRPGTDVSRVRLVGA